MVSTSDLAIQTYFLLCHVLYKIAAKADTNCLRVCLGNIISEEQSAFVLGHLITDIVLVAYESVHSMKRRKEGKNFPVQQI
jgi:uncharacterized membrane protein